MGGVWSLWREYERRPDIPLAYMLHPSPKNPASCHAYALSTRARPPAHIFQFVVRCSRKDPTSLGRAVQGENQTLPWVFMTLRCDTPPSASKLHAFVSRAGGVGSAQSQGGSCRSSPSSRMQLSTAIGPVRPKSQACAVMYCTTPHAKRPAAWHGSHRSIRTLTQLSPPTFSLLGLWPASCAASRPSSPRSGANAIRTSTQTDWWIISIEQVQCSSWL